MRNVDHEADELVGQEKFDALPARVQEALGELTGAAKEGLLALSIGVGLGVLGELMAEEVEAVVGPKGRHDFDRAAVRHGHEAGEVTLGGRRVPVERPRARAVDGSGEVRLATYAHFADRDPLTAVVLEQMLAGVSTRRFERTREPVGQEVLDRERSTSKSAVSREFVGRTGEQLRALMSRSLSDLRLAALMLDGIELKGRCCVVCLGISTDGVKILFGLLGRQHRERHRRAAPALRSHRPRPRRRPRRARCPRRRQGAALGRRPGARPGPGATLRSPQGTQRHRPPARTRPARRQAQATGRLEAQRPRHRARPPRRAGRRARALAPGRRRVAARGHGRDAHPPAPRHPPAALEDTQLDQPDRVDDRHLPAHLTQRQALASGDMCLRWTAAGMLEAERQFRKIIGYQHLAALANAVEADLATTRAQTPTQTNMPTHHTTTEQGATLATTH